MSSFCGYFYDEWLGLSTRSCHTSKAGTIMAFGWRTKRRRRKILVQDWVEQPSVHKVSDL
jgi:hypothetical protein